MGLTDIVKFLLEAGADPNDPGEVTATLLFVHFHVSVFTFIFSQMMFLDCKL